MPDHKGRETVRLRATATWEYDAPIDAEVYGTTDPVEMGKVDADRAEIGQLREAFWEVLKINSDDMLRADYAKERIDQVARDALSGLQPPQSPPERLRAVPALDEESA